jgi:hypothetical protein
MQKMKQVKISEVLLYLKKGVTRWKKEDLGFGSLEEIYNLTFSEVKELIDHPKIKGVKTKIPTLMIIDDTEEVLPIPIDENSQLNFENGKDNTQAQKEVEEIEVVEEVKDSFLVTNEPIVKEVYNQIPSSPLEVTPFM